MSEYNEKRRKRRAEASKQGLCSNCCINKPSAGFKWCDPCRGMDKRMMKQRTKRRLEKDLCKNCGGSKDDDSLTLCASCTEYMRDHMATSRALKSL